MLNCAQPKTTATYYSKNIYFYSSNLSGNNVSFFIAVHNVKCFTFFVLDSNQI